MIFEYELLILIAMIGTILVLNLICKLPTSIAMATAAVVGALVGGEGIPVRHLFEGTFAFLDTAMIISTAMIFMFAVKASGTFEAIGSLLVQRLYNRPMLLLVLMMLVIIFPGMLTGTASIAVLCAGAIVAPILEMMDFTPVETGTFIAVGATLGMAAPPVNIPAMLIASSVDMTYRGFTVPLLCITMISALVFTIHIGLHRVKPIDLNLAKGQIDFEIGKEHGFKIYLPILLVVLMIAAVRMFPKYIPDVGMPLLFFLGAVVAAFTGRKFDLLNVASAAMRENVSVLGKIMAIGMFLQIFILVGVRGYIVVNCFTLPMTALFIACVVLMPIFGGISVYGSASLFGPPLLLAMLGGNEIIIAASLSVLAILGELMPPSALCANYAADMVHVRYREILARCSFPVLLTIVICFLCLIFSGNLGFLVM